MDRLAALAAFVAIADKGSFAAAAREHRVSPQAVTRAISGLEEHLGVRLFQRTTRSVRLTEEGAHFLARCRQVLGDLRDAEQSTRGAISEPQGILAVTAPVVFGRMHVVPIVAELLRRHPKLGVRLLLVDHFVQLVDEGIDIAVRIGKLADSSLRAIRVGEVRRVLVASPGYLKAHDPLRTPADLKRHQIITFTGISSSDDWRFGTNEKVVVQVRPRFVVNNADAAIAAAEAGLGITRVVSYMVSSVLAKGRLRTTLDEFAPPAIPINLLYHAGSTCPGRRAFLDQAVAYLRSTRL